MTDLLLFQVPMVNVATAEYGSRLLGCVSGAVHFTDAGFEAEAKDEEESEPEIMFRVENDEEEDNSLALQESPEEPKRAD